MVVVGVGVVVVVVGFVVVLVVVGFVVVVDVKPVPLVTAGQSHVAGVATKLGTHVTPDVHDPILHPNVLNGFTNSHIKRHKHTP